ncbi:MAG: hypothetical protein Q4C44_00940 [bacterium]|nr:hypothetical protein [bacterium]
MREAIGGTWLLTIVLVFIVLFSSFLALSINYSKAFKVKNGIVNIIEKKEGLSDDSQQEIKDYLSTVGYLVYSKCPKNLTEQGDGTLVSGFDPYAADATKYRYCVAKTVDDSGNIKKSYYKVTVFFRVDLPILGEIFTFPISGETKPIYFAKDEVPGWN